LEVNGLESYNEEFERDSLEDESPELKNDACTTGSKQTDDVELVYNSVLGLYYDPLTKQHFDVKPE
jgi:hypothetical protein